jgi:hypothetical protein
LTRTAHTHTHKQTQQKKCNIITTTTTTIKAKLSADTFFKTSTLKSILLPLQLPPHKKVTHFPNQNFADVVRTARDARQQQQQQQQR